MQANKIPYGLRCVIDYLLGICGVHISLAKRYKGYQRYCTDPLLQHVTMYNYDLLTGISFSIKGLFLMVHISTLATQQCAA